MVTVGGVMGVSGIDGAKEVAQLVMVSHMRGKRSRGLGPLPEAAESCSFAPRRQAKRVRTRRSIEKHEE
jgi:hypothetical protein